MDLLLFLSEKSLSTFILLGLVVFSAYILYFKRPINSPSLPPFPGFRLPIIGHIFRLDADMRGPFRQFRKQYGDIYSLQVGSKHLVVISGYDAIKEAWKTRGKEFVSRPNLPILDIVYRGKRGLINTKDKQFEEHRQLSVATMAYLGMGKSKLEVDIHSEVQEVLNLFENFSGRPFDPHDILKTHVANVASKMLLKKQFKHTDPRARGMMETLDDVLIYCASPVTFFPWLVHVPGDPGNVKKLERKIEKLYEYIDAIVDEQVSSIDKNNIDDLPSAYIKQMNQNQNENKDTTLCLKSLSALIVALLVGGSDTTFTVLKWALVCLVEYPEKQERLFNEIVAHLGTTRLPSMTDKASLVYLQAFYMEVLRYCNLVIFGFFRCVEKDTTFRGYTIPPDAVVVPDLDSVMSDPTIWQDPDTFQPERFIDDDGKIINKEEYIPFSIGKRNCIGQALAKMNLFIFLGALVQRFEFTSADGEELTMSKVDGKFGVIHAPKPYNLVAKVRKVDVHNIDYKE